MCHVIILANLETLVARSRYYVTLIKEAKRLDLRSYVTLRKVSVSEKVKVA